MTTPSRGPVADSLDDVVASLSSELSGAVITPGDSAYDSARRVWNAMFDERRPVAILRCAGEDDVVAAVRTLGDVDAPVAIRGGGHHIAGFGSCDGGFVIDLGAMRSADLEDGGARVRVGGGATLHEVDTATAEVGRSVPLGVVSETGVAGLTLSGGVGWLTRRHGYTCDNLLRARVVTAAGEVVEASEDENSDLLWGLRGGGGNFGVVTEFEFQSHPADQILIAEAYHLPESESEIEALLRFYREWTAELSNDVTVWVVAERAGPAYDELFPGAVGKLVVGFLACTLDPSDKGRAELAPLERHGSPRLARISPLRMVELQHLQDQSGAAAKGQRSYMKGEMLTRLTDETIAGIAERVPHLPTAGSLFEMGLVGGAMGDRDEMDAAVGLRDALYVGGFSMMGAPDDDVDAGIAWVRDAWKVLGSGSAGGTYLNFDGEANEERVLDSLGADQGDPKNARLVELKRRFDPGNRFRVNHNINPS